MISKGSCDPEDLRNDAENSAFNKSQEYLKIENNISQY